MDQKAKEDELARIGKLQAQKSLQQFLCARATERRNLEGEYLKNYAEAKATKGLTASQLKNFKQSMNDALALLDANTQPFIDNYKKTNDEPFETAPCK